MQAIDKSKVVAIVLVVHCVVDRVVLGAHHGVNLRESSRAVQVSMQSRATIINPATPRSYLSVDVVMDIVGPHSCAKQHDLLSQGVHGSEEQHKRVRNRLENPIYRVERQPRKGGERMLLVVLVVDVVKPPVTSMSTLWHRCLRTNCARRRPSSTRFTHQHRLPCPDLTHPPVSPLDVVQEAMGPVHKVLHTNHVHPKVENVPC